MPAPSPPHDRVQIRLIKAGHTKITYPARLLHDDGAHVTVRANWAGEGVRDFGFVRFAPGDVFTEHYWRDRWYAIKEVRTADGTLKGWYCDVTRPAVRTPDGDILSEDLDLDLWVSADGSQVIRLDEDEFAESGLTDRDPQAAQNAVRALDDLEHLAKQGEFTTLLTHQPLT
ncbi:DUF402 domain-containing protein [Streptomyces sp. NPDC002790]|uniref:DUF402 domain-containing protein n=1 Tax=Streptomyces sp. NPDC002790 TaxID=3154431 RepID=UPI003327FB57